MGSFGLSLLNKEESDKGDNGESGEAGGADVNSNMAASDCQNMEQVDFLVGISGLAIGNLFTNRVINICPYEIGSSGNILVYNPSEIVV